MQRIITLLFLIFIISDVSGQKLSLNDITNLCNRKNWEDVNQALLSKGWTYYDSEKGDTYKYNTITWSFNKDYSNDKAQGWFYLHTYEDFPNKISYSIFNKESYTLIQNSINSAGFKLIDSEIENNEIISTYANAGYILKIKNEKRKNDDWSDGSVTAYNITLIKKAGIFDSKNGRKTEYYDDNNIKAEYTLVNGKLNGQVKSYYNNGKLKLLSNYSNGIANGKFIEFDEDGNKTADYIVLNNQKNGTLNFYEDDKISYTTNFKSDKKNGTHIAYYYDENGNLNLKNYGEYLDDKKNGIWKLCFIEKDREKILDISQFVNGIPEGPFQEVKSDSLIIGRYKNGLLDGEYKVYRDTKALLVGGVIDTDIKNLKIQLEGNYLSGKRIGYWKFYGMNQELIKEGNYENNLEAGTWKYYYQKYLDENFVELNYSKELYLIENYSKGELEGESLRLSYIENRNIECSDKQDQNCTKPIYHKISERASYIKNQLDGNYEIRDSINNVIVNGLYRKDLKQGFWSERDEYNSEYASAGNYLNNLKVGEWHDIDKQGNKVRVNQYLNGKLDGECFEYKDKILIKKKIYSDNSLLKLILFDEIGKENKTFDLYDIKLNSLRVKVTSKLDNNFYSTQEYKFTKDVDFNFNIFDLYFFIYANSDKGFKDGQYNLFDSENKLLTTGEFNKEKQIGLWKFYHYDEKIRIESMFFSGVKSDETYYSLKDNDYFDGTFVYTDEKNSTIEKRKIKKGLRNGKTTIIDLKTNKTINTIIYKNGSPVE
ncbi:toxin-antitoxin system YwqK family antitoxin [Flavobacterium subsaxonicum]|uniref:Membrane-binding protein n=1 Tax=Flavobacterium subsaxonicum WB 4.1-42 = DSM 21790 TaxID=1121898 RepID=A0A0A2MJW6_9FLAO|nr:hypothetical protein [Flavobacterium subsaxonicum]KGO92937.1 hypothetical protein Q766_09905 [Flavobacterium subsaxonicum WB 4.1-42 = DSM 21790]